MDADRKNTPNEPTLGDVVIDLWAARFFVFLGGIAGVFGAFVFLSLAIPHYKTSMIIAPASPMTGAESSSMLANDNLFALRYLVQRIGAGAGSDFQRFENIYTGPSVAAILLKDSRVLQGLRDDIAFTFSKAETQWSDVLLSEYLQDRVTLEPIGTTPAKRLVYYHQDKEFAEYFLSGLHRIADNLIRLNIREDAKARVEYLTSSIEKTSNPEHRRTLTTLLMEQERLLMLVSIDQPYAASVLEPASSSVKPEWPNLYFVHAVFIILGMMAGFLIFGLRQQKA